MIGTQLGRWIIDRQLGRGAMGTVYFAHAADAPNEVRAIKVLSPELARDPVARQRFQRETDVLCLLDHPNIVRFDGAGMEGEALYYVMEYVSGPDCETRLRDVGRWRWTEVLDLAIQVGRGLKYAHDQGIVHRDLKPANVLLAQPSGHEEAGRPFIAKIGDFGVARLFNQTQLTGSGHFIGTALYMAPEQAAGKPATKRSDFYSLGCMLYTLLTGRPPFNGTSLAELVHKHQFAQPERPSRLLADLPHDIDDLVVRLLSKDPAMRPADGSVLLKRLESIRGKLARKHNLSDTAFRNAPTKSITTGPWESPDKSSEPTESTWDLSTFFRAILLTLALAVVIGLIVWKLTQPRESAAEMVEKARPLMQSAQPEDWDRAWAEHLEPMISRYPDHPYAAEVEAFRPQLEALRSLRRMTVRGRRGPVRSEAHRFFEIGLARVQSGDVEGGRDVWRKLITAFGPVDSEQPWVQLAKRALHDIQPPAVSAESPEIKIALEKARNLVDQGKRDQAEAIWNSLEELYGDEEAAKAILDLVQAERKR